MRIRSFTPPESYDGRDREVQPPSAGSTKPARACGHRRPSIGEDQPPIPPFGRPHSNVIFRRREVIVTRHGIWSISINQQYQICFRWTGDAERAGRLFGTDAEIWMDLQVRYDLWHARRGEAAKQVASIEAIR